jgi:hypothetical protein
MSDYQVSRSLSHVVILTRTVHRLMTLAFIPDRATRSVRRLSEGLHDLVSTSDTDKRVFPYNLVAGSRHSGAQPACNPMLTGAHIPHG